MSQHEHGTEHYRFVVIGAGITGLAAAHRLAELGHAQETLLLEASDHLGGVLRTERRDGFLLEHGPDAFLTEKPWALDLCRRVKIEDQILGTNPECRRSFILRDGRLHEVPEGFYLMAPARIVPFLASPLVSWPGKMRICFGDRFLVPRRRDDVEESLGQFVRRRFGREALEYLAQPMVAGIYTADPEKLSLKATFPKFLELEREYGSVIKGLKTLRARAEKSSPDRDTSGPRYGLFAAPRDGMQSLTDAVAARLNPGRIRRKTPVDSISPFNGRWEVFLPSGLPEKGPKIEAERVIVALPAWKSAELLATTDADLAKLLRRIPYGTTLTVNLAYERWRVRGSMNGMGFVVPAVENRRILACSFSSVKFAGRAPEGKVLLRAFMGGACRPDLAELDDESAVRAAIEEISTIFRVDGAPLFTTVARHPRSLAQYHVGHLERVAEIRGALARHSGLFLAGNAYDGGGVPDCIRSGELAAEAAAEVTTSTSAPPPPKAPKLPPYMMPVTR